MLRATHIRTKLAVALAVPLAGLVAVAGFEVVSAVQDVGSVRSQTELATASLGPGSLITRLQDERNRSAIDLMGLREAAGPPVGSEEEARSLVDDAAAELRGELDGRGAAVASAFAPAWEALAGLEQIRADIDARGGSGAANSDFADGIFTRYTAVIESFFDATSAVALSVDDSTLRNGVEIVDAAARQSEVQARILRRVVIAGANRTTASRTATQEVAALRDRGLTLDDQIKANAIGPFAGLADATFGEAAVADFNGEVDAFLAGETVAVPKMLAAVSGEQDSGYLGLRSSAAGALTAEADRIEGAAVERERLFVAIALGMLVLAGLVTWLASRSITRPLASLKAQAEDMAGTHLPAAVRQILDAPAGEDVVIPEVTPIAVRSRDEVAEVAAALSAVQTSALDLAVEQAVLRRNIADSYINLGRRNQNLLSRQIDFITELERNESDPDALEGLFRLDHLATRMRRNAESLLVLAGIEPPRQWAAPVKLSDVVRAALGEVEDYQRVVVQHLEPASITGAVASDVAHITAELIENALSFSPPDQPVEVKGRLTVSGYTLAISDNGFGIAPDDLERANRRLAGAESFTVAPSRYLGHYVAGHLASRLGIAVDLQPGAAGGITARVDVPMGLLANEETDPRLANLRTTEAEPVQPASPPAPAAHAVAAQPIPTPSQTLEAPAASAPPAADAVQDLPAVSAVAEAGALPSSESFTAGGLPRRGDRRARSTEVDGPTSPSADEGLTPEAVEATGEVPSAGSEIAAPLPPVRDMSAAAPLSDPRGTDASLHAAEEPSDERPPKPAAHLAREQSPPAERGFGGLAMARPQGPSLYTVAAQRARDEKGGGAAPATTATGLTRRVPGAQRPGTSFGGLRPAEVEPMHTTPSPTPEPTRSSPDDVYSFLSSFQSGVERGLADAHSHVDHQEDDR
ncbi:MAG: ATP-binding protein [Actinomycetota bacterium]